MCVPLFCLCRCLFYVMTGGTHAFFPLQRRAESSGTGTGQDYESFRVGYLTSVDASDTVACWGCLVRVPVPVPPVQPPVSALHLHCKKPKSIQYGASPTSPARLTGTGTPAAPSPARHVPSSLHCICVINGWSDRCPFPCRTCGTMPVASLQINFLFSLSPALLSFGNLLVGSFSSSSHSLSPNIFAASSQASFILSAFSGPCTNGHVHSFFRNWIFCPRFRPSFHRYWEGTI